MQLDELISFILSFIHFLNVCTSSGVYLFDQLLWPIFQSSIYTLHFTISSSSYMFMVTVHGDLLWAAFVCRINAPGEQVGVFI